MKDLPLVSVSDQAFHVRIFARSTPMSVSYCSSHLHQSVILSAFPNAGAESLQMRISGEAVNIAIAL